MPSKLYILRTKPNQDAIRNREEYNIYFKNIILPFKDEYDVKVECEYGKNYGDFWRINEFPYECDSFPLTIAVYNEMGIRIAEKSCTVYLVDAKKDTEFTVLPIGDSMTHNTTFIEHATGKLNNVKTRGIRTFNGRIYIEGRGGWTYDSYFSNNTICWGGTSPFLFPKGVEGKDYYGDYEFEEMKKNPQRPTYSYDGLPIFELKDGMIYHLDGKLYKKDGDSKTLVSQNPQWEVSFKKYVERFNVGHFDAVSILMGGNDLQAIPYEQSDEKIEKYVENTQKMISAIRELDDSIKIIINLPIIGADQYAWGKERGCKPGSKEYKFNVIKAANALIKRFDGQENIYISATLLNIDPVFGFDKQAYRANMYCDHYVMKHSNWVHPNSVGYKQMGDALAAVLEAIRN